MESFPASYYGPLDKNNPVLSAFQNDLKEFRSHIKKLSGSHSFDNRLYSRGSLKLLDIWNKYKPRLPQSYFEEHLLQIADFLLDNKLYKLALWQGYRLYLQQFCTVSLESIQDVELFKDYFSDSFNSERSRNTFRAIQGECQCIFYLEREKAEFLYDRGVQKLLNILGFLRILLQAVLPDETFCWIVYNGSILIYSICRFLMLTGHTSQVLEFLLWACTCLETSVPLMTAKFLPWRATLYCAVCECYFHDCCSVEAEVFARRALDKVNELATLEEMTGSEIPHESQQSYKEATVKKLAVMVFKRSVYEHRRKPKGLFRPKQKNKVKELQQTPWPRTQTERVLVEMFEGNAARFLAVLEALHDSSARPLQTGLPEESELQDVVLELISAGTCLLTGFGESEHTFLESMPPSLKAVSNVSSIIGEAVAGKGRISLDAAVKFVKQLFRFEQWSTFRSLSAALMSAFANMEGCHIRKFEMELKLLEAVENLMSTHRVKFIMKNSACDGQADKNAGPVVMTEEFFTLIQTLHACCCCTDKQDIQPDTDLVLDIVLFVWTKCKTVFRRGQLKHSYPVRYLGKVTNHDQWVETLFLLCEVAHGHQLAEMDFIMLSEMTLRLATVLESSADSLSVSGRTTATTEVEDGSEEFTSVRKSTNPLVLRSRSEQLQTALTLVERCVDLLCKRRASSSSQTAAVVDELYVQKFVDYKSGRIADSSSSLELTTLFKDLHLELLVFQHRLGLKLCQSLSADSSLLERVKKNKISKCVFLVQKALLSYKTDQTNRETKKLLEDAVSLIEKAELEERKLVSCTLFSGSKLSPGENGQPPPAPILLSRTNCSITFKPAPYAMEEEVIWYGIYGREAEGVNQKVRLKDCYLHGTGDMVPAKEECLLHVHNLDPDKLYIFAVAAFDAQGKMVGKAIGETTRPLLSSLPLPLLTTWAHIAQVAYQTGVYDLAKRACNELWSRFTLSSSSNPEELDTEAEVIVERLAKRRLNPETMHHSSPLLQQLFISTIFIWTNICIQEEKLFCDSLSDGGPLIWGQEARLAECDRMLVAVDLALNLNDAADCLQAVVSCYGLLAPIIFYQISSKSVTEVLLKCFTVLQETPEALKQKRPAATTESLQHMVACITYYLVQSLYTARENQKALFVLESGKKLLEEITDLSTQPPKKSLEQEGKKTAPSQVEESTEELKALRAIGLKNISAESLENSELTSCIKIGPNGYELPGQEDPALIYIVIENSPLQHSFKEVMKFKQKPCVLEFVVQLLHKALQDNELDLVLQWQQPILKWLCRHDDALLGLKMLPSIRQTAEECKEAGTDRESKTKNSKGNACLGRKLLQKKILSIFDCQISEREVKAANALLNHLGAFIRKHQHRSKLTQMRSEDSLWRCHINLSLSRAHLAILRNKLRPSSEPCFSRLPQSLFSLAHCGMLILWKSVPQRIRPPELTRPKASSDPETSVMRRKGRGKRKDTNQESITSDDDLISVKSDDEDEVAIFNPRNSPKVAAVDQNTSPLMEILNTASVHLRRAMVLAHRWGYWTTLQYASQILWDQSRAMIVMCEHDTDSPSGRLTVDQLHKVITPLLVLASDLFMDMMERLKLWNVYDNKSGDPSSCLHFSAPDDDGAGIDPRWFKSLILHTLELLYYQAKWETLAYLGLLFNSYTRERYSHMVTPLLVHAQRRLLERIDCFGGPAAPQPHFTYTEMISGEKVTCRSYRSRQLLFPRGQGRMIAPKNANPVSMELSDAKRAMCLVCVPLDVKDTLRCFRETLERGRHTQLSFQHSRNLLLLLLADTQQTHFKVPFSEGTSGIQQGKLEISMAASTPPGPHPPDLSNEDFRSLGSIYSTTLPPSQLQIVFTSYKNTIRYLQETKQNSFLVQAFHDLGNLHFYNGNQKSALSFWSKALDCALKRSGVLETLDGGSWDSSFFKDTLRQAGIWGCLQGALLSAKIAQHILTSNINKRTKCCLLAAKLFKCLLVASLPHPTMDLSYSTFVVQSELIPGIDLFSHSDRGDLKTTVSSLSFLCHWLHATGHFLKVLPVLALYLYVARTVCRDSYLTIKCRILKVKVLTEMSAFAEAIKELFSLTMAEEIPLPHGCHYRAEKAPWSKDTFNDGKPLLDPSNLQVLENVLDRRPSKDITGFYGSRLITQLLMARVHLILALCDTIHDLPISSSPESPEKESSTSSKIKGLKLSGRKLTLGELKFLVLKEAHSLLSPEMFIPNKLSVDPEELELAVEIRLLMARISMQQGRTAVSASLSASTLQLLQRSPVFQSDSWPCPPPTQVSSAFSHTSFPEEKADLPPQICDAPESIEAIERMHAHFWLRCRLALVHSLIGHIPGTAVISGADSSAVVRRLLKEGLVEAEAWGDPDSRALLLLYSVQLHAHSGQPREESTGLLQEIVGLLSGHSNLSHRSQLTLAEATMLLSESRGTGSQTLHVLAQKLLQQQLCAFGELMSLKKGGAVEFQKGLKNIYLPQLPLLAKTTIRIGLSLSLLPSDSAEEPWMLLQSSQEVLQSAFKISKESANRDHQLETDILSCTGIVGRQLVSMKKLDPQRVVEMLFECLATTDYTLSQNLWLIHRCYLEIVLIYLQKCEQTPPKKCDASQSDGFNKETTRETCVLICWICLRIALKISGILVNNGSLLRFTGLPEGVVPPSSIKALPPFTLNDLVHSCGGGLETPEKDIAESLTEAEDEINSKKWPQLTWVHLYRYYMHLSNLLQGSTQPSGLCGLRGFHSSSESLKLEQRLSQMHRFFMCQHPPYRERYIVPDPPAALILQPQRIQHNQALSDLEPSATADIQELIIQWYRTTGEDNMILLLFTVNDGPVSAMNSTVDAAMAAVQAGQRSVRLDRLNAIQGLLSSPYVEVDGLVSPSFDSKSSSNQKKEPNIDILLEKSTILFSEIQTLLRPEFSSELVKEMPCDPSPQSLKTLGECFNPATGGALQDPALITWLLPLLG